MSDKIKWGVIGSGGIARRRTIPEGIAPAENADLAVVFDVNAAVNAEVASEFDATAVVSLEALLASDIDAVYVASPVNLHREHVLACAKAGKHVLCEKPLGLTIQEAQDMIAACEAQGVQLGTAFMMRFCAQHQAALKLIGDGKLGTPTFARAQLSCWYPAMDGAWRQTPELGGGGSLVDMGTHCIDLLEMFFGNVQKVSCFINTTVQDYASEDSAVVLLSFENGATATVDNFFCVPDSSSKNRLELYGSQGSILAQGTIGQGDAGEMVAHLEGDAGEYEAQQTRDAGDGMNIAPTPINTYRAEIEGFSQALIDGVALPVGADIGMRSQKIIAACYDSAKTGKAVEIG
jgi:predicted dehydrogenase